MIVWPEEGQRWRLWMIGVNVGFYSLLVVILAYLFLSVKYRISHPFWSRQPVFHNLNISWWANPPGIIEPVKQKAPTTPYFDPWSVKVFEIDSGAVEGDFGGGNPNTSAKISQADTGKEPPPPQQQILERFRGEIIREPQQAVSAVRSAWHLVSAHYLRHPGLAEYVPPWSQFISHLLGHSSPAHISLYYKSVSAYNQDIGKRGTLAVQYKKPVSCMITRPVECVFLRAIRQSEEEKKFGVGGGGSSGGAGAVRYDPDAVKSSITSHRIPIVGYVDFLCTHASHRKQQITPKLIYTHYKTLKDWGADEARQASQTSQAKLPAVFLFKREGDLAPFVPLVVYNSFCYDTLYWPAAGAREGVEANIIDPSNFPLLVKALDHIRGDFANLDMYIQCDIGNLREQIRSGILVPVVFTRKTDSLAPFIGVVVLRQSGTTFRSAGLIELIATYMAGHKERSEQQRRWFAAMVRDICVHITHSKKARYLLIEDMGHTREVLTELQGRFAPQFQSSTAYYFYNYATTPIDKHRAWMLN